MQQVNSTTKARQVRLLSSQCQDARKPSFEAPEAEELSHLLIGQMTLHCVYLSHRKLTGNLGATGKQVQSTVLGFWADRCGEGWPEWRCDVELLNYGGRETRDLSTGPGSAPI